ncbi:hypothetical protein Bbelb_355130 [Branchiostoma belcheri]|nr:hypothetical protein Bbelb_355130 [Branchiostoma belcheri]
MAEGQGRVWTQDETRFLIILWADQTIQSRLETSRNREGIQMLVDGLAAEGYFIYLICTPKQVRAKFKALKHKYQQWTTNVIVPLPKKGDLSLMTNYRGISLMSIAAKVYNKILLTRIREHVDPILRNNQAGFRQGRSCAQQVHILRRIIEAFQTHQLSLIVTFIDFKKAFDSINRNVMFAVLRHYGVPVTIVNAISVLYNNSKSAVMVDGNITKPFQVTTGVLQGDVLAPFLFIILVDYLMKKSIEDTCSGVVTHPRQSSRHPAKILNDLNFADDIALLEASIPKAQSQLNRTATAGEQLGLVISVPKTEYMTINCNPQPPLEVYGQPIKHVTDFRYLGSMMASSKTDLARQKALAWTTFWKLQKIWRNPTFPTATKIKLFNVTCVSVFLYGCETWVLTRDMEDKINSFATSCLRIMLNIKRIDHVSNREIYKATNTQPLIFRVRQRQLRFIGHALRMPVEEPLRTYALYVPPHGRRRPGRQRMSYLTYIQNMLGDTEGDLSPDNIAALAADRRSVKMSHLNRFLVAGSWHRCNSCSKCRESNLGSHQEPEALSNRSNRLRTPARDPRLLLLPSPFTV